MSITNPPESKFLDLTSVLKFFSISRTGFWRLRQSSDFPETIVLPGLPGKRLWDYAAINAWANKHQAPADIRQPERLRAARANNKTQSAKN